jgi:hypothetical protein
MYLTLPLVAIYEQFIFEVTYKKYKTKLLIWAKLSLSLVQNSLWPLVNTFIELWIFIEIKHNL